jgi:hypothetical protein
MQRIPRAQIGTLVMATSGIQLANGFFGTFIALRVAVEDFGATMSALVLGPLVGMGLLRRFDIDGVFHMIAASDPSGADHGDTQNVSG